MGDLDKLSLKDTYSLILFTLFKTQQIPEYATLCELIYLMNEDTLVKMCQYFGGMTIKIPTLEELNLLVYTLNVYNEVVIKKSCTGLYEVLSKMGINDEAIAFRVKGMFKKVCEIMEEYQFVPRES